MKSRATVSHSGSRSSQTPENPESPAFVASFDNEYGRFSDVGTCRYFKTTNVNINRISSPKYERLEDEKGDFTSLISLVMLLDTKQFFLLISNLKREERLPVLDIKEKKISMGKFLTLGYEGEEEFEVTLEFLHAREADVFDKYISRILEPNRIKSVTNFITQSPVKSPVSTKRSGVFQSVAISVSERIEDLIRDVIATDWTYRHVKYWLQHIHCQPGREGGEVVSLFEYIGGIGQTTVVTKYFDEGNTIYNLEKQLLAFSIDPEKVDAELLPIAGNEIIRHKLLKQIEIIRLNDGFFTVEYFLVLKKRIESAKKHLKKSNDPNLVLSLPHLESRMMHEELHLWNRRFLRNTLLFSILFNRSLKSYVENLTLTFDKLLKTEIEKDDKRRVRKVKKKNECEEEEDEGEGDDDDDGGGKEEGVEKDEDEEFENIIRKEKLEYTEKEKEILYFNHRTFERVLGSFNTDFNLHLEVLSFPVWLKVKQNLFRRRREKLQDKTKPLEKREREMMIEVEDARGKAQRWKQKLRGMELKARLEEAREKKEREAWLKKNPEASEDDLPEIENEMKKKKQSLMARCRKMKEKYETGLFDLENKLNELRNDLKELRTDIPLRRKRYNTDILNYTVKNVDEQVEKEFLVKKHRFQQIEKMVEKKAEEVIRKSPVDFSVKLVLSYQRNPEQQAQHAQQERPQTKSYYVDWLHRGDEIFHFPFFKFGLVHASLIIKNVNFHWLANSLVRVNEIREDLNTTFNEIACVDVDCPMLHLNKETLIKKFDQIASAIVYWNANIEYSDWHMPILESNSRNCQEFVTFMLDVLDYTKFFDEVERYITKDLKNWVREKHNARDPGWRNELMFFPVGSVFKEKFKDVFDEHFHLLWDEKKRGIIFRSHDELDNLVHSLRAVSHDEILEVMFPGQFQLLKSLDRAFWVKTRRGDTENTEPSQEHGCPFNSTSSHKKRRRKKK